MKANNLLFFGVIIFLFLGFLLFNSFFIVDQRQYALVFQFGNPMREMNSPGLKFKIPFIENVAFFDKRIQTARFVPEGQSNEVMALDQKTMKLDAYAKYKIIDPLKFYRTALDEERFRMRIIPVIESSIREVIGSVLFIDILGSRRHEVLERITSIVRKQAKSFGVEIVDVRIIRLNLPDKSRNAVYERMRTDREKEAKEIRALGMEEAAKVKAISDKDRVTMIAEAKGQAEIIKGEGESEVIKLFATSISQDPDFYSFYRSMQAYKTIFNDEATSMVLSTNNTFFRHFN